MKCTNATINENYRKLFDSPMPLAQYLKALRSLGYDFRNLSRDRNFFSLVKSTKHFGRVLIPSVCILLDNSMIFMLY